MVEGYLEKKGFKIIERNYRNKTGEIDLIALAPNGEGLVFIEVKTRKSSTFGYPEESVDARKLRKIEKTAFLWLEENPRFKIPWRIDILALEIGVKTKITHLENVTL